MTVNERRVLVKMMTAVQRIANGRTDCGRPLAAEVARQIARAALIDVGEKLTSY